MGKIGNYEYPELSVSEALKIAQILVKDFHGKVSDLDNFAKAIGHKTYNSGSFYNKIADMRKYGQILVKDFHGKVSDLDNFAKAIGHKTYNSGSFYNKIADMRKYGLMDKKEVTATELANVIANPKDSSEKQMAMRKIISNITLFERLKERLKTRNPVLEQFRTQLIEVTQDRNKASNEAEKIRKIYIEALAHTNEETEYSGNREENEFQRKKETTKENMISASIGDVSIEMPKNSRYIAIAESLLKNLKAQIELEEELDKPK